MCIDIEYWCFLVPKCISKLAALHQFTCYICCLANAFLSNFYFSPVFNYAGGAHSVDEVSAADYAACTASNALQSDSSGTTTVTLKTAGKHYFICGIAGHCSNGMKLVVDVAAASPAPAPKAPSTTPTTPSTTPATPASPGTSSGLTPTTPATVLAPPAKQSAGAAGLRAGSWAMLGLAGLAGVQLGLF